MTFPLYSDHVAQMSYKYSRFRNLLYEVITSYIVVTVYHNLHVFQMVQTGTLPALLVRPAHLAGWMRNQSGTPPLFQHCLLCRSRTLALLVQEKCTEVLPPRRGEFLPLQPHHCPVRGCVVPCLLFFSNSLTPRSQHPLSLKVERVRIEPDVLS